MHRIRLDARKWSVPDDFYSDLLEALGGPEWHGRNLDALSDTLRGGIARIDPPYEVAVDHTADLSPDMLAFLERVHQVFEDAREDDGCEVLFRFGPFVE